MQIKGLIKIQLFIFLFLKFAAKKKYGERRLYNSRSTVVLNQETFIVSLLSFEKWSVIKQCWRAMKDRTQVLKVRHGKTVGSKHVD